MSGSPRVRQSYRSVRSVVGGYRRRRASEAVFDRFADFTMIPAASFVINLELALEVAAVPGAVVECGVWRGGMSAGIATVLGPDREYYLLDSFEGLPAAQDIDGPTAIQWQQDSEGPAFYDNCAADIGYAEQAMAKSGASDVHIVKGWFSDTLPLPQNPNIALLRLDGDWYDSTLTCLEHLFPQVVDGGIIIVDDYYTWDGCSRAVHDYLSRQSAVERLRELGGVCFIRKAHTEA